MSTPLSNAQRIADLQVEIQKRFDAIHDKNNPPSAADQLTLENEWAKLNQDLSNLALDIAKKADTMQGQSTTTLKTAPTVTTPFKVDPRDKNKDLFASSRITAGGVDYPRDQRDKLDADALDSYNKKFDQSFPTDKGYTHSSIGDYITADATKGVYDPKLALAVVDILNTNHLLKVKLQRLGVCDLFENIFIFGTDAQDVKSKHSLFTEWMHLTDVDVIKSGNAQSHFGDHKAWIDKDLIKSLTLVESSIQNPQLEMTVRSRLMQYRESNRTGPLMFWLIMDECASCDETTLDKLSNSLKELRLSSFEGENIVNHGAAWQQLWTFLSSYNKTPVDWKTALRRQYAECTVPIFVTHFQTLYSTESSVLITHDSMIREAIRFSRELKANNEWLPTTKTGSVFHTQSSHKTSVPRLDGQGREISSLPTHDAGGKPIDRREPSEHEPKTRVNPHTGRQEHWCATDWRWGNHTTEQHDEWRANLRAKRKRQKEKRDQAQQQETQQGSQASEAPPSQPSQQAITIDRNNFFRAAGGFGSGF